MNCLLIFDNTICMCNQKEEQKRTVLTTFGVRWLEATENEQL